MSFDAERFKVTSEHLALLPHLWIEHDDTYEFGAAAVNPKKPYGNSDVFRDIADAIGIEGSENAKGEVHYSIGRV